MIYSTRPLNDGTNGFRFDIVGAKGLYRKRSTLRRYGMTSGATMTGFHIGKRSIYFEQFRPQRHLHDFALREYFQRIAKRAFGK